MGNARRFSGRWESERLGRRRLDGRRCAPPNSRDYQDAQSALPEITVTNNLQKADFVLTLDHEGGKGLLAHNNKVAVFNRDGDDVFSKSTRELGNSVKDACAAMLNSRK